MTNMSKAALVAVGVISATVLGASSAFAFGGEGGERFKGPHHGGENSLVPTELREEWRAEKKAEFENLTDEEREALKAERREAREAHRAARAEAFESFSGLTRDEVKEARENGTTMGELLSAQGITESDAETFLTTQANEKVDDIVERHDLDATDEQTLRDRIAAFVDSILAKWFGN